VLAAVAAGSVPRILQYKLLPHFEFIEFAAPTESASAPHRGSDKVKTPLQPVVWYR